MKYIEISWEELTEEYLDWERKENPEDPDEIDYDEMYNLDIYQELDFNDN